MDNFSRLRLWPSPDPENNGTNHLVSITAVLAVFIAALPIVARSIRPSKRPSILPGPLKTQPASSSTTLLSPAQESQQQPELPYPPDYFPGARDVPTPYGSTRCYEFGPRGGRKVLLLHGISTSCMTLTHVAHGLVARGCRVMLYDLFGRGYSDGVGDLPYDERLFVSQALCVLASSELAWTGQGQGHAEADADAGDHGFGFHLVGFSLGGGIAVHLATTFPGMVRSLILLAPAGMVRDETFGAAARFVFKSGWVPEGLLEVLTRWRLKRPISASTNRKRRTTKRIGDGDGSGSTKSAVVPTPHLPGEKLVDTALTAEIIDPGAPGVPEAPCPLQLRVVKQIHWQIANHGGFVPAFMSSLRHAPITASSAQREAWEKLADRKPKTTCFIFGIDDQIISEEDYREDVLPLVGGEEHVVWADPIPGGHDFPMLHPDLALKQIWEFWGWA